MNDQAPWEKAAIDFASPVLVVAQGVTDRPRLSQWGGGSPDDPPTSVTLSYDKDDVSITTYWDAEWWTGCMPVFDNIWEFVENGAGWRFAGPFDFEGRKVIHETKHPAQSGYFVVRHYESDPPGVQEQERSRIRKLVSEVDHREVDLPLGGSDPVRTMVVRGAESWDAAFETTVKGRQLIGALHGTGTPIEPLGLILVDDLIGYLRR